MSLTGHVVNLQAMTVCGSIGRPQRIIVIIPGSSIWAAAIVITTIRIITITSGVSSFFDKRRCIGITGSGNETV